MCCSKKSISKAYFSTWLRFFTIKNLCLTSKALLVRKSPWSPWWHFSFFSVIGNYIPKYSPACTSVSHFCCRYSIDARCACSSLGEGTQSKALQLANSIIKSRDKMITEGKKKMRSPICIVLKACVYQWVSLHVLSGEKGYLKNIGWLINVCFAN